jgi:NADH-quinone oxidoreductase subunit N
MVFSSLVRADLYWSAIIGILLSVVALGYYLRVLVAMWMQSATEGEAVEAPAGPALLPATLAAGVCVAFVIAMGVLPNWFMQQMP